MRFAQLAPGRRGLGRFTIAATAAAWGTAAEVPKKGLKSRRLCYQSSQICGGLQVPLRDFHLSREE